MPVPIGDLDTVSTPPSGVIDEFVADVWLSDDPGDRKVAVSWHRYKTGRGPLPV